MLSSRREAEKKAHAFYIFSIAGLWTEITIVIGFMILLYLLVRAAV